MRYGPSDFQAWNICQEHCIICRNSMWVNVNFQITSETGSQGTDSVGAEISLSDLLFQQFIEFQMFRETVFQKHVMSEFPQLVH